MKISIKIENNSKKIKMYSYSLVNYKESKNVVGFTPETVMMAKDIQLAPGESKIIESNVGMRLILNEWK